MKRCRNCKESKYDSEFREVNVCKSCRRGLNLDRDRTVLGMIKIMYQSQKTNSKKRGHVPPSYSLDELKSFFTNSKLGTTLYESWVLSEYASELKPSIDRIKSNLPYTLDNIQMMTWKENDDKGKVERQRSIVQSDRQGNVINTFVSMKEASRITGIPTATIHYGCNNLHTKETFSRSKHKWEYE